MQPLLCKRKPIRKIIPFTKKKVELSIKSSKFLEYRNRYFIKE